MIQKKADIPPLFDCLDPKDPVPVLLHLPHSGTYIPPKIYDTLQPDKRDQLDETDWFLDQLYDFASALGITVVRANYHRWVADLNRDPSGNSLYNDGRVITEIVPLTDFNGEYLYINPPSDLMKTERVANFHTAYFKQLEGKISSLRNRFNRILIWDGHSIRRQVPGIQAAPFPDLILGTNDFQTCRQDWYETIRNTISESEYQLTENIPFKGGHITRNLYNEEQNIHTVQLEMSKDLYMDDSETNYDSKRANKIKELLKLTFENLIEQICQE